MDKALKYLSLFLLWCGVGYGQILAPILVGQNTNTGIGTITAFSNLQATALTNTVSVTASSGATLVAFVDAVNGGSGCAGFSISVSGASSSFSQIGTNQSQNFDCGAYFYAVNVNAGALSVVVTFGSVKQSTVIVYNIPGASTTSPLVAHAAVNNSATPASLSLSGSSGNAMICAVTNYYGSPNSYVAGNPSGMSVPTNGSSTGGSGNSNIYSESIVLTSSASTCTMTSGGSQFYGAMMGVVITK
jgi:hypothetical protein